MEPQVAEDGHRQPAEVLEMANGREKQQDDSNR